MYTIDMNVNGYWIEMAHIEGCEAAYATYRKACEFAEAIGAAVVLTDVMTCEIIADFGTEEEDAGIPFPTAEDLAEAWWEG